MDPGAGLAVLAVKYGGINWLEHPSLILPICEMPHYRADNGGRRNPRLWVGAIATETEPIIGANLRRPPLSGANVAPHYRGPDNEVATMIISPDSGGPPWATS